MESGKCKEVAAMYLAKWLQYQWRSFSVGHQSGSYFKSSNECSLLRLIELSSCAAFG